MGLVGASGRPASAALQKSDAGRIIPHVAVWIRIEDVSVKPWALSLVYTQAEATKLSLADAREAVKAVQTHYVNHLWVPAHISGDTYMVVGQEKAKARVVGSSRDSR